MGRLMVLAGALSFALSVFAQPTALPSMTRDEISQQQLQQKERQQQQPYNNAPVWKAARGRLRATRAPCPRAGVLIRPTAKTGGHCVTVRYPFGAVERWLP